MGNKDNPRRASWKKNIAAAVALLVFVGGVWVAHGVLNHLTEQETLLIEYQDNLVEQGSLIDQQKKQLSNQRETVEEMLLKVEDLESSLAEQEETYTKVTEQHEKDKQSLRDERDGLKADRAKLESRIKELEDALAFKKAKAKEAALAAAKKKSSTQQQVVKAASTTQVSSTKKQPLPSRGNKPEGRVMMMEATGYVAMCDTGCTGITATGIDLRDKPNLKVIAVDPSVIPLGSKVWVEGYGYAIAADTGGAIKGNRIDLHMPTTDAAWAWGRRAVQVRILQ